MALMKGEIVQVETREGAVRPMAVMDEARAKFLLDLVSLNSVDGRTETIVTAPDMYPGQLENFLGSEAAHDVVRLG